MLPFARNEATRFISPTKTPEYLAAGKPVVSTSIRDVVRPYGEQGLARIADTRRRLRRRDRGRAGRGSGGAPARVPMRSSTHMSWDGTWTRMIACSWRALSRRGRQAAARHTAARLQR